MFEVLIITCSSCCNPDYSCCALFSVIVTPGGWTYEIQPSKSDIIVRSKYVIFGHLKIIIIMSRKYQ